MPETASPVAEQFDDLEQQHEASLAGMWVFLVTEVLFFGGLFAGYAVYKWSFPQAFSAASRHLDVVLGTVNTAVLIGSSLTVVLAVHVARLGRNRGVALWTLATLLLGGVFLAIKGYEYHHKAQEGLVPGPGFVFEGVPGGPEQIFYAFYFVMTGTHALHMVVGIGLWAWVLVLALRGRLTAEHHAPVEIVGLYWHFVDVVWIFLFPLLYLIGLHE